MEIHNIFSGSWCSNCYVLISDSQDRLAAVIDPSTPAYKITEFLQQKKAKLKYIILTHGHFDHVMALDKLRDETGVPAYIHEEDAEMLSDGEKNAYKFFFGQDIAYRPAEETLADGDKLMLGSGELEIISTPGHSKGSICILNRKDGFMITGDTLFSDNIGRYDLHGGDMMKLYSSLSRLSEYDKKLTIYPGHGDSNLLGRALENISFI